MQQTGKLTIVGIGDNAAPIWGMDSAERVRRMAGELGLPFATSPIEGPQLLVDLAFASDPALLRHMASEGIGAIMRDDRAVMVRLGVDDAHMTPSIVAAMINAAPLSAALPLERIRHDRDYTLYNSQLRKREHPFVTPLNLATARGIERESYYAAYKGVTDILTRYLWPQFALVLTRLAARIGLSPNMVTAIGAVLCVVATVQFWHGAYWSGMAAGLLFMILDTVDGKLARCTITSSFWGNIFDHGIDLVHPPIWWWAWGCGLAAWGLALDDRTFTAVLAIIVGGYVVQRLIEGAFIRMFGMHIHVWRPIDSRFRLITARRNPNMVILFAATVLGRPDLGLVGLAIWTLISLGVHALQLAQAYAAKRRGVVLKSWLSD